MIDGRKMRGKLERDDPILGRVRICTWCGEECRDYRLHLIRHRGDAIDDA